MLEEEWLWILEMVDWMDGSTIHWARDLTVRKGLGGRWGGYHYSIAKVAHCSLSPVFCTAHSKNGFTLVNSWIKSKEYFKMYKLYRIQISVSYIVLLAHNSFFYILSIPMSTLRWQLSSWVGYHMWHSHSCTWLLDALQIAVTQLWLSSVSSTMYIVVPHFIFTRMSK